MIIASKLTTPSQKIANDYMQEFDRSFATELAKAKHEGHEGNNASLLAKTSVFVTIANRMVMENNFYNARVGMREADIAELQKRNEWQTARIKALEEELASRRKR